MAKFRSWNEKKQRFYYFVDGKYFDTIKCEFGVDINKSLIGDNMLFNWQNAEQGTIIDGQEIFENDFIKYQINNIKDKVWSDPAIVINTGYSFETRIKPYDKDTPFNQCLMYPKRFTGCEIIKLGNIHQGELDEI